MTKKVQNVLSMLSKSIFLIVVFFTWGCIVYKLFMKQMTGAFLIFATISYICCCIEIFKYQDVTKMWNVFVCRSATLFDAIIWVKVLYCFCVVGVFKRGADWKKVEVKQKAAPMSAHTRLLISPRETPVRIRQRQV